MREIKFKAWNRQAKRFVDDNDLKHYAITFDGEVINFDSSGYDYIEHFDVVRYTGLKDKNGKEIFEGDILKLTTTSPHVYSYVAWNEKTSAFAASFEVGSEPYCEHLFGAELCEVIGNIYENKELLEAKQ